MSPPQPGHRSAPRVSPQTPASPQSSPPPPPTRGRPSPQAGRRCLATGGAGPRAGSLRLLNLGDHVVQVAERRLPQQPLGQRRLADHPAQGLLRPPHHRLVHSGGGTAPPSPRPPPAAPAFPACPAAAARRRRAGGAVAKGNFVFRK